MLLSIWHSIGPLAFKMGGIASFCGQLVLTQPVLLNRHHSVCGAQGRMGEKGGGQGQSVKVRVDWLLWGDFL